MLIRALSFFLATALAASSAGAAGPYGIIQVGNWQGGAYTDNVTRQFSHCAAGTTYTSGIYFLVSINHAGEWSLGFSHPSWQLRHNDFIAIDLTFDEKQRFHVTGSTIVNQAISLVAVPMPPTSALIAAFRRSYRMTALARGSAYEFNLTTTSALLPALASCVVQAKAGQLAAINIRIPGAGEVAIAAQPPGNPAPRVTSTLKPASPATNSPSPAEMQIEAIELASNFILKSQLQNPRVLTRSETPIEWAASGAAWTADEAVGAVRIIDAQLGQNGLDVAAAVAAADAKECKGKFASGRVSELVDSNVVFRGFAMCEDSGGNRASQYFIVLRRKGGLVIFSVISAMASDAAKTVVQEERLEGFRRAALSVVGR